MPLLKKTELNAPKGLQVLLKLANGLNILGGESLQNALFRLQEGFAPWVKYGEEVEKKGKELLAQGEPILEDSDLLHDELVTPGKYVVNDDKGNPVFNRKGKRIQLTIKQYRDAGIPLIHSGRELNNAGRELATYTSNLITLCMNATKATGEHKTRLIDIIRTNARVFAARVGAVIIAVSHAKQTEIPRITKKVA